MTLPQITGPQKWTPEDEKKLVILYPNQPTKVTAERLDRSFESVRSKAHQMRLKKSKEYLSNLKRVGPRFLEELTKRKLEEWYLEKKMSAKEISRRTGHKKEIIARYLDLHGIPRRTVREAILAKMETDPEYTKRITSRQRVRSKIHDNAVRDELSRLKQQGFRCIPIGLLQYPKPDIIVIKGDNAKVFAVEVELSNIDYGKYENIKDFDDIIWIDRRSYKRKTHGNQ